jgi:HEAT repeat protein
MRDAISTAETMGKISTMLFNAQRYVRQSAVMVLAALSAQPTGVQPMLETIETIVTMLQDPMHDVRKSALDVFTRLAQNGEIVPDPSLSADLQSEEVRKAISRRGPLQRIMTMLEDLDFTVREWGFWGIVSLIQHGEPHNSTFI